MRTTQFVFFYLIAQLSALPNPSPKGQTQGIKINEHTSIKGGNAQNNVQIQAHNTQQLASVLRGTATDNLARQAQNGNNGKDGTRAGQQGGQGGNVSNNIVIKSQARNDADYNAQKKVFSSYNARQTLTELGKDKAVGNAGNGGAGGQGANGGAGGSAMNRMSAQIQEGKQIHRGSANIQTGAWGWTRKMLLRTRRTLV